MVRHFIPKPRILMAALLLVVFTCCSSASAFAVHHDSRKKTARQAVEAMEEQWRIAQLQGDTATMDRLLSEDFVGITPFGQVTTKSQTLARTRDRTVVLTRLELFDIKVKLIGPIVAVVTSRAEIAGKSDGRQMNGSFRYTRVYQRLASGAWKITSFEATRTDGAQARGADADAVQIPASKNPTE
jgi:ketosteroid isomerase-like protein